jgi:hypothetical protein
MAVSSTGFEEFYQMNIISKTQHIKKALSCGKRA